MFRHGDHRHAKVTEARECEASRQPTPPVTTIAPHNTGGCVGGTCSWYDKCTRHREQDARDVAHLGVNAMIRARHRAYND